MPLPPATIHIKRKATDEPVEFLRVHESNSKRQRRATDFVFSRQAGFANPASSPIPEPVRRIKQLPRGSSTHLSSARPSHADTQEDTGGKSEEPNETSQKNVHADSAAATQSSLGQTPGSSVAVRRFHISRTATNAASPTIIASGKGQKRSTIFVEHRSRPSSSKGLLTSANNGERLKGATSSTTVPDSETIQATQQKKPGLAARIPANRVQDAAANFVPTPSDPVRLPSGLIMPWDVSSEQLAAEMQAYTLQEIGHSLAKSETKAPKIPEQHTPRKQTRFKPKKPALRYQERHPDEIRQNIADMDVDEPVVYDEDLDDDSDYIIDTYIRMPAQEIDGEAQLNFGLLILDSQPDIDEFYHEDSDHDEQENDEEEDENAEDHYTADYPDDEVDSDDEFDRNAYNYRNHNASDLEEFDENDATFSDDEGDSMRHPWSKKQPAWMS